MTEFLLSRLLQCHEYPTGIPSCDDILLRIFEIQGVRKDTDADEAHTFANFS
jgi:hypothetical protein